MQKRLATQLGTTGLGEVRGACSRGGLDLGCLWGTPPPWPIPRRWGQGGLWCVALLSPSSLPSCPGPGRTVSSQGWLFHKVWGGKGNTGGPKIPRVGPAAPPSPGAWLAASKFAPSLRAAAWGRGPRGGAGARPEGGVWRAGRALPPGRPRLARDQGADVEFPARPGAPPAAPRPATHSASGRSCCGRTRVRARPAPAPRRMEGAGPRGAGPARRRGAGGPLPPLLSPLLLLLWLLPSPGAPEELNPRGRNVCRASG